MAGLGFVDVWQPVCQLCILHDIHWWHGHATIAT